MKMEKKIMATRMIQFIETYVGGSVCFKENRWSYQLPPGFIFSKTKPESEHDRNIPIVEKENINSIIGYAIDGWYAIDGEVLCHTKAMDSPDYQGETPTSLKDATKRAARQAQQIEEGCYGD